MNDQMLNHPNNLDRNRSIIWAREALNSSTWICVSFKPAQDKAVFASVEIVDGQGTTLLKQTNARYDAIAPTLTQLFSGKTVVCWDVDVLKRVLADAAAATTGELVAFRGESLGTWYSRFEGVPGPDGMYQPPKMPTMSTSEVTFMRELMFKMAGANQIHDTAVPSGNWSAAFYKPKMSPADKIKSFFRPE